MIKIVSVFLLCCSLFFPSTPIQAQSNITTYWFHPNVHSDFQTDWSQVFQNEEQWKDTLERTDIFGFWMEAIEKEGDLFLPKIIPLLNKYNVDIAIETAANNIWIPCDTNRGQQSGLRELQVINKIRQYGGTVKYISIDDVLAHTIRGMHPYENIDSLPCFFSEEEAISQMISYMQTVHEQYPDISIGYISNLPNRLYNGIPSYWGLQPDPNVTMVDAKNIYEELLTEIENKGEELDFFHIDSPYDFTIAQFPSIFTGISSINWMERIRDVQSLVHNHGLRFGVIFNSQRGGQGIDAVSGSDQVYANDTMAYVSLVEQQMGLPEDVILQSWYSKHPAILPFNQPDTLTNLAYQLFPIQHKPGDANGDNKVNGQDYIIWLIHYKQLVTGSSNGDFNNNGRVDGQDYIIWLTNYGK